MELSNNTNAGIVMEKQGKMITQADGNLMSYFGCANCKSMLRNIETFRRADGNVLQLLTCIECDYKWKEVWLRGTNPNH
ncbi:MAG TPA: hypothetical protein VL854_05925 [Nitrososphaeraceae archaeon]|nr:hypothetical protein [Nitrososphaeraceae archaeon]